MGLTNQSSVAVAGTTSVHSSLPELVNGNLSRAWKSLVSSCEVNQASENKPESDSLVGLPKNCLVLFNFSKGKKAEKN